MEQVKRDNQLEALTQSVMAWKGLWEASTLEIRELKMEIKELRSEIDKLKFKSKPFFPMRNLG
jgi:predicted  nucleic acid-binding Zn-ribbon protein